MDGVKVKELMDGMGEVGRGGEDNTLLMSVSMSYA